MAVTAAAAAPRAPELEDCVADGGAGRCEAPPQGSLAGAAAVATSPDGRSVYVAAYGSDSVFAFQRGAGGALEPNGCVANDGAGGCADPPADALGGASGVAVSPGGGDVYVTAGLGKAVSRFSRSGSGAITFATCTATGGAHGCEDPVHDSLVGATGVAVGPGGGDLYVTSFDGAAVTHLVREPDGMLATADCIADAGNFDCAKTRGNVLEGAAGIAIAPGGKDVYVTSYASGSLSRFRRAGDGSLSYRGCWADGGANGCRKLPVDALSGATSVALDRTGKHLFTAAQTGRVASFERRRSGKLGFVSCVGRDGKGGCRSPKRDSLRQATGVAVAGRDVYVAAVAGDAVTRLSADRRGRLAFVSCIAAARANGCRGGTPPAALDGVYALAVEGSSLLAAAPTAGAVSSFALPSR